VAGIGVRLDMGGFSSTMLVQASDNNRLLPELAGISPIHTNRKHSSRRSSDVGSYDSFHIHKKTDTNPMA